MTEKNLKYTNIILIGAIVLCLLTMVTSVVIETIIAAKSSDSEWYSVFFIAFLILIIFLITPFIAAIGYEGMNISALSPTHTVFWFWLAMLLFLGCAISLRIIKLKQLK